MPKLSRISFILTVLLLVPCLLRAQRPGSGGRPSGGEINVQVRAQNGQPGPRGLHIRLESAEGGPVADCETVDGGKCQFNVMNSGSYLVRMIERGYKEVEVHVDLISTTRGYAYLELKPLPAESSQTIIAIPAGQGNSVSVQDLSIPEKARQEFQKGQAALQARNIEDGAKHLEKALKEYETYPEAYRLLGEAYLELQDWKKSETALKRSAELEPSAAVTFLDLGAVYNQQKEYPQAEQSLRRALELSPDAGMAKYELAKTYMAQGKWEDAEPYAKQTVKDAPDMAPGHVLMGNIYLKRRDAPSALHEFEEYLRLEPAGAMAPQVRDMVAKLEKIQAQP